jgi:hypothetical protein
MEELNELREMLCAELKKYGEKGDLTTGSLDVVDKLAHAVKNLDKIIEGEGGYSSGMMPRYYYEGDNRSYRNSYARDRMGRYSRDGMADKLRELMNDAPDERTRSEIKRLADKMERM